jgi:hypothetical protein
MQLDKLISKYLKPLLLILFFVVFLLTRVPRLNNDEINPDGVNWYYRSEQFVVALKSFQLEKTYQHYHPGVTLMWIVGATTEFIKQVVPGHSVINNGTFETFNFYSKLNLVVVQLILTVFALFLLEKILGFYKALFSLSLLSFEPFFIGNSRIIHLDILMTLFILIGFALFYLVFSQKFLNKWFYVGSALSGVFISLAFLTKSISILAFGFLLVFGTALIIYKCGKAFGLKFFCTFLVGFVVTLFVVFPAMLVKPIDVIVEIFSEGERIGARKGHSQIVFGETTMDPGVAFYLLVLALKTSVVLWIGVLLKVLLELKKFKKPQLSFTTIFEVFFFHMRAV